jgi:Tol biopolymer transport system component
MRLVWIATLALSVTALSSAAAAGPAQDGNRAKIAFVRGGNLRCAIFSMNADGREQRRLTDWNASCSAPPVWSPDGLRLAFYARDAVWVMNADGSGRRRLSPATHPEYESPGPSFSPDGGSIAFARNPSTTINASAVYVVPVAGGSPKRLTKERLAYDPLWSPRGDLIAFRSDREDDEGDIYVMRPNGSRARRLTELDHDVESFAWSPDGRFLAYAFYDGPIYRVPAGGGPRRLLARSAEAECSLAWSPDGGRMAFENVTDQALISVRSDIWVMAANGHNERRVTRRFFNFHPSWSADSRVVAFAFFTRLEGPSRTGIAVVDADGHHRRELTSGGDSFPAWQPRR